MKKLFLFLITLVIFASCTDPIEKVKDPEKSTTVYLQQLPKDTVAISIDKNKLYVFNKDNTIEYKVINISNADHVIISMGFLLFIVIYCILLTMLIIIKLTN